MLKSELLREGYLVEMLLRNIAVVGGAGQMGGGSACVQTTLYQLEIT